ncbi:MAG: hypothetical protein ACOX5G_13250 [Kiritimatiellia bacterium]|jgi:hypothetical protein
MKVPLRNWFDRPYPSALVPVPAPAGATRALAADGRVFPVQRVPATPFDEAADVSPDGTVALLCATLAPLERLDFDFDAHPADCGPGPAVRRLADGTIEVANGPWGIRLPADGAYDPPFPAPFEPFAADGSWASAGVVSGALPRGSIHTAVEAAGPCCVQWRTVCRWGNGGRWEVVGRWAAGADALLVCETAVEDADAHFDWRPFAAVPAQAWTWGGGEQPGPMRRAAFRPNPGARPSPAGAPRVIQPIAHIGYYNQWNLAWCGFTGGEGPDAPFAGLFSAFGGSWRKRGFQRPLLLEGAPDGADCFLRFPIRAGRRLYGLVFSTRAAAGVDASDRRCLPNARKVELSDLRLGKTSRWILDPPPEPRSLRLLDAASLEAQRARLLADPGIRTALETYLADAASNPRLRDSRLTAAAWAAGRDDLLREQCGRLEERAARMFDSVADGGYEALVIFHGRQYKADAYDLDLLWALGLLDEARYRRVRGIFLATASMYADPDYCRYGDFWPGREPEEGIAMALRDEMGDTPVPPNFASEYFTTVGMMAELFPGHPAAAAWRAFAEEQTLAFLETHFEPDGTYHESINYHSHALSEFACYFQALRHKGGRDGYRHPVVEGSYRHFAQLLTPPLENGIAELDGCRTAKGDWPLYYGAASDAGRRAAWPADGNSGGHGLAQEVRDDLPLAATAYAESNPALAAALAAAWNAAGRPLFGSEHPLATLALLQPDAPAVPLPWESAWRRGLGVLSKSVTRDGDARFVLFRAGRATHHMDFDQGNLQIFAYGRSMLGDHGYHTSDTDGRPLPAAATWLHNTLTYGPRPDLSSGYLGLELAPEPACVELGAETDRVVHRIVNTNFRDLARLPYNQQIHAPATIHVRRYLYEKRLGVVALRDTLEESHGPAVSWFHPRERPVEQAPGDFRCGPADAPHLRILVPTPATREVVENRRQGPLFSLGFRVPQGGEMVALLVPCARDTPVRASWDPATGRLDVSVGSESVTCDLSGG